MRWGFLGAGFVASRALAPAVHAAPGARLQAVAARDRARAEGLEPQHALDTYQEVVESSDVDAVYISLTNEAHLPWIVAALDAGKHVLCEKPLTLDATQCAEAFAVADDRSRLLVEATWTRWHPRHRRADQLLGSGAAGAVRSVEAAFTFTGVPERNYRLDPRRGGGALLDVGPYLLWPVVDWCHATWTSMSGSSAVGSGVDLTTSAVLRATDCVARLQASIVEPERQALRITAETLALDWSTPAFTSWHAPSTLTITEDGSERSEQFAPCDPYQIMVEDVSRAILGEEPDFLPSAAQSRAAAELLDQVAAAVTAPHHAPAAGSP